MTDLIEGLREQLSPIDLDCAEGFDALLRAVPLRAAEARPRRRIRVLTLAAAAVATLAVGGVAVATGGAHTGLFGLPGMTENDTSEYLDMEAPDFRSVALDYTKDFDYAPGYSAQMYLGLLNPRTRYASDGPEFQGRGHEMQVTGVRGAGLGWAFCSWARTSTADTEALEHMRRLADSDLARSINMSRYNLGLVDQAEHGNPAPLQQYADINCPSPTPWPAP